jgi:hypothetical protein
MEELGRIAGIVLVFGIIGPLFWMGVRKFEAWFWVSIRRKKAGSGRR